MTTVVTDEMVEAGKGALLTMLRAPNHSGHPLDYELTVKQIYLAMSTASQPPVGTVPYSDDHLGIDQPYAEDAVERAAEAYADVDGDLPSKEALRAAIQALGKDEGLRSALEKIKAGSKRGIEMFEQRVRDRKGRLTWWAVNVLQDNLAACEGTASSALSS